MKRQSRPTLLYYLSAFTQDHNHILRISVVMVAAPFNPPSADLPGKPFVPDWIPPPITQEKHNFATLKSIDLSLLDSDDAAVVDNLIEQVKIAIRDDGFLFLENYGISLEQVSSFTSILRRSMV